MATKAKVSMKQARDIDANNAYTVTVTTPWGETKTFDVHTDKWGDGLWINGQQTEGTCQFTGGKNVAGAIRRYFENAYSMTD